MHSIGEEREEEAGAGGRGRSFVGAPASSVEFRCVSVPPCHCQVAALRGRSPLSVRLSARGSEVAADFGSTLRHTREREPKVGSLI